MKMRCSQTIFIFSYLYVHNTLTNGFSSSSDNLQYNMTAVKVLMKINVKMKKAKMSSLVTLMTMAMILMKMMMVIVHKNVA